MKVAKAPHRVELRDEDGFGVSSCHRMARGTFWLEGCPRELSKMDLEEYATALLKLARSSAKADDAAYVEAW